MIEVIANVMWFLALCGWAWLGWWVFSGWIMDKYYD